MISAKSSGNIALIPVLVGGAACVLLIRSGFAVFVFLLPLGFIGYGWGPKTLWPGLIAAVAGNSLLTLVLGLIFQVSAGDMIWDMLYFAVMTLAFAWVILPFEEKSYRIPGACRLALGALVCTSVSLVSFLKILDTPVLYAQLTKQIEDLTAFYSQNGPPLQFPDTETIIGLLKTVTTRGGALFSAVAILLLNRQLSVFLIRLFGGPRRPNIFRDFRVYSPVIWVLSVSILLSIAAAVLNWTVFGIIVWNIMILCVMMYLAQGLGIIGFFISKSGSPAFLRFVIPVVFIMLLFSPGINMVLLGAVIILGIAENWVPFRVVPLDGPPSTPEA